jgi:hypothetical protein
VSAFLWIAFLHTPNERDWEYPAAILTDFVGEGFSRAHEKARRGSAGLAFDPANTGAGLR